jgi:hypothetical protein
VDGMDTV